MLGRVMDDDHVDGVRCRGCVVRRVRMRSSGVESWTVVGPGPGYGSAGRSSFGA